jgi:hypothetical protein
VAVLAAGLGNAFLAGAIQCRRRRDALTPPRSFLGLRETYAGWTVSGMCEGRHHK